MLGTPITPEQKIRAFIALIQKKHHSFLAENRVDLGQQIVTFPEAVSPLSDAISAWCKKYPNIDLALREKEEDMFGSTSGKSRGQDNSIPEVKTEDYKTLIKNQIRESFPETTKEKKPSDSNK